MVERPAYFHLILAIPSNYKGDKNYYDYFCGK